MPWCGFSRENYSARWWCPWNRQCSEPMDTRIGRWSPLSSQTQPSKNMHQWCNHQGGSDSNGDQKSILPSKNSIPKVLINSILPKHLSILGGGSLSQIRDFRMDGSNDLSKLSIGASGASISHVILPLWWSNTWGEKNMVNECNQGDVDGNAGDSLKILNTLEVSNLIWNESRLTWMTISGF